MDIAGELGDYLNDLEEINFTFDGGNTNLNFAEAALLIQGSACIYSKKVEYLHALVFQALDFVADKKRQEDAVANGLTVDDDDGQDEATFLALDDCLDEAEPSAIDLDDADFFKSLAGGADADVDLDVSMDIVDAANQDAVASKQQNSNATPTINLAHSALLQMIQGKDCGDGVEYKMSSCSVHPSGALVLDAADVNSLDSRLTYYDRSDSAGAGAVDAAAAWLTEANRSPSSAEGGTLDDNDAVPLPMDDDNHFGGGGFVDDDSGTFAQEAAAGPSAPVLTSTQQQADGADGDDEEEEEDFDPYAPLDMHDPNGLPLRPYKKGRPGGAKALQKKKDAAAAAATAVSMTATVDGSSSADDVESMVLSLLSAAAAGAGAGAATNKAEFAYALQSLECSRRALRQKTKGGKKTVTATGDLLGLGASAAATAAGDGEYDDEGDDDGWAGAGGFDDDDAGEYDDFEGEENQNAEGGGLAGLVGTAAATAAGEAGELTYEELCQAHINKFLAAAAAAEVQSELTTRVQTWKSRVDPSIAEQDAREQFDIHVYGSRVINRLAENLEATKAIAAPGDDESSASDDVGDSTLVEMGFGDVVAGQEKWQVARMFASMLQLINNGNIEVHQEAAAALLGPSGVATLPAPPADAAHTGRTSKKGAKNKKGGKEGTKEEEKKTEEEKKEIEARPSSGAPYSTLETGVLKLTLLTANIRELNISAARHRPDEVPVPALPAPAQTQDAVQAVVEEMVQEEEEAVEAPAEKEKPIAKKARGRPKKTTTKAAEVTKTVEPMVPAKTMELPEGSRSTRASRRVALADNNSGEKKTF